MRYRPEIDGLRAIAVVPVVLYHTGLGFSGGYIGVDIFFVISGFLITRIINDEMVAGTFSYADFYERRARRILPALFLVLATTLVLGCYALFTRDLSAYAKSLMATLLFSSNIWFWLRRGDYFALDSAKEPLLHTWSLAVEEQFYIVFPILLLVFRRIFPGKVIRAVFLLTLLSLIVSAIGVLFEPVATFYSLPTRAWELGVGSLLGLGAINPSLIARFRQWISVSGAALIVFALFLYDSDTPFPGLAAVPPVLGAAAILLASSAGATAVGFVLSHKAFVATGRISYSLYLWHWPVIVFAKLITGEDTLPFGIQMGVVVISVLLAVISWRFVEEPFRRRSIVTRRGVIFTMSGGAAALSLVTIFVLASHGLPDRFGIEERKILRAASDRFECPGAQVRAGYCLIGDASAPATFLLWGDSHASAMAPAVNALANKYGAAGVVVTHDSCPPLIGVARLERPECAGANDDLIAYVAEHETIRLVMMAARWPAWRSGDRAAGEHGASLRIVDGKSLDLSEDPELLFDKSLSVTLSIFQRRGIHVVLIGDVPEIGWDVPYRLLAQSRFGFMTPGPPSATDLNFRQGAVNAVLQRESIRVEGDFVDPSPAFCQSVCMTAVDGRPIYVDDDHLTATASREMLSPLLEEVFKSLHRSQEQGRWPRNSASN